MVPKIPEESQPLFSTTNVPGVQFPFRQEFGKVGRALQEGGQQIESTAGTINEVNDEIQRQHDISTASNAEAQATLSQSKILKDLALSSSDGFVHDADTGQITKNPDGTQRTIGQEYRTQADQDYTSRQDAMTPRAAAMFRQSFLPKMTANAVAMDHKSLEMQNADSDQKVADTIDLFKKDFESSHLPDAHPYYNDTYANGAVNLRPDQSKFSEDMQALQLWRTRQGPRNDENAPAMKDPTQVTAAKTSDGHTMADGWLSAGVNNILEPDSGRKFKTSVPITSLQQIHNLRDVVEGVDPQSRDMEKRGLPTVHQALSAQQLDEWRVKLDAYKEEALKVDKSDFENHLQNVLGQAERAVPGFKLGEMSPSIVNLYHAAEPLGFTPDEKIMKIVTPLVSKQLQAATGSPSSDLSSYNAQLQHLHNVSIIGKKSVQQAAQMLGIPYTDDMGGKVLADAMAHQTAYLKETEKEAKEDLAAFAAKPSSGPQRYDMGITYRSPTMHLVEQKLQTNPSPFLTEIKMPNGKNLAQSATDEMTLITSKKYGAGAQPTYLSRDAYESWAGKLTNAPAGQADAALQALGEPREKGGVGPDIARTMIHQLVETGKLNPGYELAQSLRPATARIAAYNGIKMGNTVVENYAKSSNGESVKEVFQKSEQALAPSFRNGDLIFGNDPKWLAQKDAVQQAWMRDYAARAASGIPQSSAATASTEHLTGQMPQTGTASKPLFTLGGHGFFTQGASVPVAFSSPNLSEENKANIQANLAEQLDAANLSRTIGKQEIFKPEGNSALTQALTPEWVSQHAHAWVPAWTKQGPVYRLKIQGMNTDNTANGDAPYLMVHGRDGSERYYEVPESQLKMGTTKPSPTPRPTVPSPVKTNPNTGTMTIGGVGG